MSTVGIQVIGVQAIIDRFRRASRDVKSETSKNLLKAGALVQRTARSSFSPGGGKGTNPTRGPFTLRKGTQQLSKSIIVSKKGTGANTVVTVGPKVKYGAIHEFGGTITPKTKKALQFKIGGKFVTVKSVTIPARPYMGPSLQRNLDDIEKLIGRAFKAIAA